MLLAKGVSEAAVQVNCPLSSLSASARLIILRDLITSLESKELDFESKY